MSYKVTDYTNEETATCADVFELEEALAAMFDTGEDRVSECIEGTCSKIQRGECTIDEESYLNVGIDIC